MHKNPFSPIFGGKPNFFFGRKTILKRFELAMADQGNEDRALFFTGTRGCGKTTLLEQLSQRASKHGYQVIDLGPDDTVSQLLRTLMHHDEITTTINPQASVSIMGIGGSVGAGSVSKTTHFGRENLQPMLIDACNHAKRGILVTIDEIQKVPIDDVSAICNAFQMASRKGYDILLAVAGLPYAHKQIIHHEGCTYLRRAPHEEIGLFNWDEADEAFKDAFSRVDGLVIGQTEIDSLNLASYGQPYLMQLLGFYLVNQLAQNPNDGIAVVSNQIKTSMELSLTAYERRALQPLLDELSEAEIDYLRTASTTLDGERLARTADIARQLGKTPQQLSRTREKLINYGYVASAGYGKLAFCVPYLADYVMRSKDTSDAFFIARQRRV